MYLHWNKVHNVLSIKEVWSLTKFSDMWGSVRVCCCTNMTIRKIAI